MVYSSCSSKDLEIPGFVPRFTKTGVPKTKALQHQPKNSTVDTVVFDQTPIPLLRRIVASNMPDPRPIDRNYPYYVNENVQPKKTSEYNYNIFNSRFYISGLVIEEIIGLQMCRLNFQRK